MSAYFITSGKEKSIIKHPSLHLSLTCRQLKENVKQLKWSLYCRLEGWRFHVKTSRSQSVLNDKFVIEVCGRRCVRCCLNLVRRGRWYVRVIASFSVADVSSVGLKCKRCLTTDANWLNLKHA